MDGVRLNLTRLLEAGTRLTSVKTEFQDASANARGLADAVGHDGLADALTDSVRPTTLSFPHNSLGLPAANTMERMATFRIDDMSQLALQRHALPYEGTLGGAAEYVFPRPAGVSVVDDVPFVLP